MAFFMDNIANMIKLHSSKQDQSYGNLRMVKIKEYDPETNRVKAAMFDANVGEHGDWKIITNWIPILAQINGLGFDSKTGKLHGHVFTPTIDEYAFLLPLGGDPNGGLIIGGIYTDSHKPPELDGVFTKAGEWFYFHATGSYLKYTNDGDLFIKSSRNTRVIVDGQCDVTVLKDCNVTIGGNATVNVDGNTSVTTGGDTTVNTDANMTANVGKNMTASVVGQTNIQSSGPLQIQSQSDISILSRGLLRLQGNLGIILESTVSILNLAPIAPIPETLSIVIPPLPPLVINAPPKPLVAHDDSKEATVKPGAPLAPANPNTTNITPNSATAGFDDPNTGLA